jgi:hypothetical protein
LGAALWNPPTMNASPLLTRTKRGLVSNAAARCSMVSRSLVLRLRLRVLLLVVAHGLERDSFRQNRSRS